jgi:hypothetical protein
MKQKKVVKLLIYVFVIQFISILFALLIEKIIDQIALKFDIHLNMEILFLFITLIFGLLILYIVYSQLYSLLTFEPITNSIFSENEKSNFLILLKKIKQGIKLDDNEKNVLQSYIDKSPLPSDFVDKYSTNFYLSSWNKIVLLFALVVLSLLIRKKENEHH